jgi:hypothetical protein
MANLSNINGKFVVEQTTGYVGVGTTDPNFPIEVLNASAEIALNASGASIYRLRSDSTDAFRINKNGVGDRFVIQGDGKIQVNSDKVIWAGGYGGGLVIRKNNATSDRLIKMVTVDSTGAIALDNVLVAKGSSVGIGTDSPKTNFEVIGGLNVSTNTVSATTTTMRIGSYGASSQTYYGAKIVAHTNFTSTANTDLSFDLGSLGEVMRLHCSGSEKRVGIGTTSPDFALDIEGLDSGVQLQIGRTNSSAGSTWMGADSSGFHLGVGAYGSGNSVSDPNGFTVLSNGKVGIGTASPSAKLEVVTAVGADAIRLNYGQSADIFLGFNSTNPRVLLQDNSNVVTHNFQSNGDNYIVGSNVGIGVANPSTKLTVKDSQDSSLYSGLKVERSANTTGAYLNAVGGALNLNTDSSMPLKFRIQNSSMQTINTDGGRAYAANASGLNMKEYGYNFTAANGVTVDLIENTSAHSDIAMVQISITAYHSSRTFFAGMGTFGGYGFHLTGAGNGLGNGGLTSTSTGTGTRKLQWSNTSGYNAVVRLYIQIRTESGITVLNGTLSSL